MEKTFLDGFPDRPQITDIADIERIEANDYQAIVPVGNVHALLQRSARLFADKTAIIQLASGDPEDPAEHVTYAELLEAVQQTANLFRSLGVGDEDAVVLLLPTMLDAHLALWGAEIAGRACPINFMLDVDHITELVKAARAKVVVALGPDPDFDIWSKASAVAKSMPGITVLRVSANDDALECNFGHLRRLQPKTLSFERKIHGASVAAFYHTGGTTGAPKLAVHTHGNQVHTSWFAGLYYGLTSSDRMVNGFPLFHVAGAFVYGAACFCAGATILIPPRLGMRHRIFVANYWRFVEKYQISYLATVPTIISTLLDVPKMGSDVSSVKALYTGGSPLPTELADNFERRFGIPVRNILGMTESAGLVSIEPLAAPRNGLSCGLRLPFSTVAAVKPSSDVPDMSDRCAVNEPGIIVISGPHVSPGYSDARRNAGMFAPTGELISGDLGHIDGEGRIFLTGRSKDVIIRGAHNIDPSLIEEAFIKHPAVLACAAVGEPDPYAGELPVVFISLRTGARANPDEILSSVSPNIFERAAIPKRITVLDALPTTAIGKIFKPALRILAVENAYTDALNARGDWCSRFEVHVDQEQGGMKAQIHIWSGEDPSAARTFVQESLARYSVPFELQWH